MSRSGYSDDYDDDPLATGRWRAQVASSIRGKRGQKFLRDLIEALDALPEKELIANELVDQSGCVCALGALGKRRGVDLETVDTEDYDTLGGIFDIAHQLAQEVMWENDEYVDEYKWESVETVGPLKRYEQRMKSVKVPIHNAAAKRWQHVRDWATKQLLPKLGGEPG